MEIGISTASLFGRYFTEETFEPMREIGAKVAEVFFATHSEYTNDFANIVNEKRGDIKIHSIHALTTQFEPDIFNLNPRTRKDAEAIARNVLSAGNVIGAKYYTFHGAALLKRTKYRYDYDFLSERVNNLINICKEYGIELCYENVHWAHFSHPEFFENLKDRCPSLKTCLDIKQAKQSGIDYTEFLNVMGDRLRTVHLCDYLDDGELAIPGRGVFDFVTLFKRLRDAGFNGACLVEVYTKNYKELSELKDSYEYILERADKAGVKLDF